MNRLLGPLLIVSSLVLVPSPANAAAERCPDDHVVIDSAPIVTESGRTLGEARLLAGVNENGFKGFCLDVEAKRTHRKWGQLNYWLEVHAAYMEGGAGRDLTGAQEPARSPHIVGRYASYMTAGDSATAHVRIVVKEPGRRKLQAVVDLTGVTP